MDRYKIIKFLNKGAFGKIYLVEERNTGVKYALKSINIVNLDYYTKSSILNEIRILIINNSEYMLKCVDLTIYKKKLCIITEYIDGGDLTDLKKNKKTLSNNDIEKIYLQICAGVNSMHYNHIIHRDLKPANILITKDGIIKICDFGISKQIINGRGARTLIGTPYCMSPEILRNQYYDYKADIWGIGCIIYFLVNNEYPFDGRNISELKQNILTKNPKYLNNNTLHNNTLNNFINEILEKDKHKRLNIKEIINKNINEIKKHNIQIQNQKYNNYDINMIPYTETDWLTVVKRIVNDNNLLSSDKKLPKIHKERKPPTINENPPIPTMSPMVPLPKIHKERKKWTIKEHPPIPTMSPMVPLPPRMKPRMKPSNEINHRERRYLPIASPNNNPPPARPPDRIKHNQPYIPIERQPIPPKIHQHSNYKFNEFRQKRYKRQNDAEKNLGYYNCGTNFYRNNNIKWVLGLRQY